MGNSASPPTDERETACGLPGGLVAPQSQVDCVRDELQRVGNAHAELAGHESTEPTLAEGICRANEIRRVLHALRTTVYSAPGAPLPALEMLLAEMLAIHFCSDRTETLAVLLELLAKAEARVRQCEFVVGPEAVRIFGVNPVGRPACHEPAGRLGRAHLLLGFHVHARA